MSDTNNLTGIVADVVGEGLPPVRLKPIVTQAETTPPTLAPYWQVEFLDNAGAGRLLPGVATDWDSYFNAPAVTKYYDAHPTAVGGLMATVAGTDGEYRFSLLIDAPAPQTLNANLGYYASNATPGIGSIVMKVNGTIVFSKDYDGNTVQADPVTVNLGKGPNIITIACDYWTDTVQLVWRDGGLFNQGLTWKPMLRGS